MGYHDNEEDRRAIWRKSQQRRRAGLPPRELQPHGTVAAYQRHKKHDEKPCRECMDAWNEEMRRYKAQRKAKEDANRGG